MPNGISNWTKYHLPWAKLDTFTRHEPFPSEELKATYVGGTKKPKKRDRKACVTALEKRWSA